MVARIIVGIWAVIAGGFASPAVLCLELNGTIHLGNLHHLCCPEDPGDPAAPSADTSIASFSTHHAECLDIQTWTVAPRGRTLPDTIAFRTAEATTFIKTDLIRPDRSGSGWLLHPSCLLALVESPGVSGPLRC